MFILKQNGKSKQQITQKGKFSKCEVEALLSNVK